MKIVDTDNFGSDYPNEKFLAKVDSTGKTISIVMSKERAEKVVEALNAGVSEMSSRYWKVVADDYELQPGFEP